MAERMARSVLARDLGDVAERFVVTSAGTGTYTGRAMTPEAAKVVTDHGAEPDGFTSTELSLEAIEAADLILTATRAHRSHVVTVEPTALRRCFTLVEFARIASAVTKDLLSEAAADELPTDPVDRARAIVATAARRRGTVRADRPDDDDIADPIGRPMAVYEEAGTLIADGVDAVVTALGGARP